MMGRFAAIRLKTQWGREYDVISWHLTPQAAERAADKHFRRVVRKEKHPRAAAKLYAVVDWHSWTGN